MSEIVEVALDEYFIIACEEVKVQQPLTFDDHHQKPKFEETDEIKTQHYIVNGEISVDEDVEYQINEEGGTQETDDLIEYEIVDDIKIDSDNSEANSHENSFSNNNRNEKRKYEVLDELEAKLMPEEIVECYVCDFVGTTYRELKNHYRSHRKLVCKVCFKTFDKQRYMMNFTRHFRYLHLSKEKRLRIQSHFVKAEQPKSMKDYAPLECFSCDHIAANSKERVEHSREHRGSHSCKFCAYNSKNSWTNLKRHMVTIHSKRIDTMNKNNPEWIYVNYLSIKGDEAFENETIYKRDEDISDLSDLEEDSDNNEHNYPKICLCCEFIINARDEKLEHYKEHEELICKMCGYNAKKLFAILKNHVAREHNETEEIIIENTES